MKIHPFFTFNHFLVLFVILLTVNLVLIKIRKGSLKSLWNWKILSFAFAATLLGLFYIETWASGTYTFKSYGFPRKIFEMHHIISCFEKDAAVRVFSKMIWKNFLQNFLLYFLMLHIIFEIIRKR